MTKHKTEDYKISAVKYYLNNDRGYGYKKTCKIFDCKKSTLRDWIKRYNTSKNLTRKNRKPISYKITKPQVKTALELLKKNEYVKVLWRYSGVSKEEQFAEQPIIKICCKNGEKQFFKNIVEAAKDAKISATALRQRVLTDVHINNYHWVFDKNANHYN